jgi:intracellular multiplication protein IcmD
MVVSKHNFITCIGVCFMAVLFLWGDPSFAATDKTVGSLATTIKADIGTVAQLLIVISYIAGVGFALAGIIQFKAHKDNPTQTPLSKPMVYLIVGACLLFLPTVIRTAGQSVFGSEKQTGEESQTSTITIGS